MEVLKKWAKWLWSLVRCLLGNKVVMFPYYYGIMPVSVYYLGRLLTAEIMIVLQVVVVYSIVWIYDHYGMEHLGKYFVGKVFCQYVQGIEKIKSPFLDKWEGVKRRWGKFSLLFQILPFLLLCDQTDPFTVFICFRRIGTKGVDRKGFALIVLVTVLITAYWVQVSLLFIFIPVWIWTKIKLVLCILS